MGRYLRSSLLLSCGLLFASACNTKAPAAVEAVEAVEAAEAAAKAAKAAQTQITAAQTQITAAQTQITALATVAQADADAVLASQAVMEKFAVLLQKTRKAAEANERIENATTLQEENDARGVFDQVEQERQAAADALIAAQAAADTARKRAADVRAAQAKATT